MRSAPMTSTTQLSRRIRPALLCFLLAGICHAQAFVFASPNTRTHMPDSVAVASQDSFEQQNFLAVARYLAAQLCPATKPRAEMDRLPGTAVEASTGLDGPERENWLMILGCKDGPAEYLSLLLHATIPEVGTRLCPVKEWPGAAFCDYSIRHQCGANAGADAQARADRRHSRAPEKSHSGLRLGSEKFRAGED